VWLTNETILCGAGNALKGLDKCQIKGLPLKCNSEKIIRLGLEAPLICIPSFSWEEI